MKGIPFYKFGASILLILAILSFPGGRSLASVTFSSYARKAMVLSRVDLRKYFEKAMSLFESARYKEAIAVFDNLIKIERSQNEAYFTPFAEIYIDKARARMKELMLVEDRRWERMKKDAINEAERIAGEAAEDLMKDKERLAREEHKRIQREEELKKKAIEEAEKEKADKLEQEIKDIYAKALSFYRKAGYPQAIVEFKKIKELDPASRLVPQADSFIKKARGYIKRKEEIALLVKMEAARDARIEMEKRNRRMEMEKKRKRFQKERLERRKAELKKIFEQRLHVRMLRERIARMDGLVNDIRQDVRKGRFEEAEGLLDKAEAEFPENGTFKDIRHYVEMQKLKLEEKALARARDITEEKMLLEVAKKHLLPEDKSVPAEKKKKITHLIKVPEIRKRLKIPISLDFKDVELDYVLQFLSDATGINIVPSSEIDMEEKHVTMKMKDMPLEDALRYILKSEGLVYRIEEDAIWVATKEELEKEEIETRVYFLNQGVGRFAEFTGSVDEETGSSSRSTEVKTIKDMLEETVDWPKDSKLTLDDRTGALILSNTPSNLGIIENLLYNLDVTPVQVLIEARFLEVQVSDVNELGVEWKLNSDWGVKQNNSKQNLHGLAADSGVDFSSFSRQDEGFNLTYKGILSHPQFQMVMHALKERQDVKTLSAPRITTLNNQLATLEVIDEFIYPTRYEVSLVQFDINGDGDFDDAGETEWANIPQDFVTRDVGILLHVKPSVGVDNKTITLSLTPEVSEASGNFTYSGDVTIPKFKTRNLSTSIIMESGETIVMGGLVKETNTKVKTKVPLLGDLPIVGGLFRKSTDNVERRNLLIFVTASVLNEDEGMVASARSPEKEQEKTR